MASEASEPPAGVARAAIERSDLEVICALPTSFGGRRADGTPRIGYSMAERDHVPPFWTAACNNLDGLLVPSRSSREAFRRSGVTVPIVVLQPPFYPEDVLPLPEVFTFAAVFEWAHPHKDPAALFRAYYEEFSERDRVLLRVKTFSPSTEKVVSSIASWKTAHGGTSPAKVELVVGSSTVDEMRAFYQNASAVVACHRGEGFGLSMWEAVAHGRAVVATGFGGATECFGPGDAYLVDYERKCPWVETDVRSLRARMRQSFEERETGERAREALSFRFGEEIFARRFESAVRKILEPLASSL